MQTRATSRMTAIRWATLVLSLFIFLSCTALCTHMDKPSGDDGKGHCYICLIAARHIVQSNQALSPAPHLTVEAFIVDIDPQVRVERFDSSLYIRPPPLS